MEDMVLVFHQKMGGYMPMFLFYVKSVYYFCDLYRYICMYVYFPCPVITNIFILCRDLDPSCARSQSLAGTLNGIMFMETHPA